ncbi:MAG: SHOCT domain-containing protein [Burkholderiaceae bacterium]
MQFYKALLLAMSGLFATAVEAQSATMPDVSAFAVGDRWEWRQVDNRTKLEESGRSVVVVEDKGVRGVVVEDMQRPLDYPYVNEPSAKPWRVWPLSVGKQWSVDVDYVRPDRTTGNLKQDARVVAYEEVIVPAGKFMAFKIEYDGYVRTSTGFNGRIVEAFWYAPAARADVKHMRRVANNDFTRELTKYPASPSAAAGPQIGAPATAGAPAAANATPSLSPTVTPSSPDSVRANRLRELEQLRKEGLITQQEYEEKRKAVLSTL